MLGKCDLPVGRAPLDNMLQPKLHREGGIVHRFFELCVFHELPPVIIPRSAECCCTLLEPFQRRLPRYPLPGSRSQNAQPFHENENGTVL